MVCYTTFDSSLQMASSHSHPYTQTRPLTQSLLSFPIQTVAILVPHDTLVTQYRTVLGEKVALDEANGEEEDGEELENDEDDGDTNESEEESDEESSQEENETSSASSDDEGEDDDTS